MNSLNLIYIDYFRICLSIVNIYFLGSARKTYFFSRFLFLPDTISTERCETNVYLVTTSKM